MASVSLELLLECFQRHMQVQQQREAAAAAAASVSSRKLVPGVTLSRHQAHFSAQPEGQR